MPIYTFSTKAKRPEDTKEVEDLKAFCECKGLIFSNYVVKLIKEANDARRAKV